MTETARERKRAYQRRWYRENRDRQAARDMERHSGLTPQQYNELLDAQKGCCAICKSPKAGGKGRFHVDHDHRSGVIRGLLCHPCNTGLGLFCDDPKRLRAAASYLLKERT